MFLFLLSAHCVHLIALPAVFRLQIVLVVELAISFTIIAASLLAQMVSIRTLTNNAKIASLLASIA